MADRNAFPCYNDGVVSIYREIERRSNFSAKLNAKMLEDMEFIAKLAFSEQSKRQQDVEFAYNNGFQLSCKVKTRYVRGIDNKCKAVINGFLYDVSYVDTTRTEAFLYLQGVGELAGDD